MSKTNRINPEKWNKIQDELKQARKEIKYLKECCEKAGDELQQYTFTYDGKEKNLLLQAMEINSLLKSFKSKTDELEKENKRLFSSLMLIKQERDEMIKTLEHYNNDLKGETSNE